MPRSFDVDLGPNVSYVTVRGRYVVRGRVTVVVTQPAAFAFDITRAVIDTNQKKKSSTVARVHAKVGQNLKCFRSSNNVGWKCSAFA